MPIRSLLEKIANEMTKAAETSDLSLLNELWAPDFVIWYNTTQQTITREEAFAAVAAVGNALENLEFKDIRRVYSDSGYTQQHYVTGSAGGRSFSIPTCIVVEVLNGKVSRVDEWWDSAQDPRNSVPL